MLSCARYQGSDDDYLFAIACRCLAMSATRFGLLVISGAGASEADYCRCFSAPGDGCRDAKRQFQPLAAAPQLTAMPSTTHECLAARRATIGARLSFIRRSLPLALCGCYADDDAMTGLQRRLLDSRYAATATLCRSTFPRADCRAKTSRYADFICEASENELRVLCSASASQRD